MERSHEKAMTSAALAAMAPATEDNLLHLDLTKTKMVVAASMPATATVNSMDANRDEDHCLGLCFAHFWHIAESAQFCTGRWKSGRIGIAAMAELLINKRKFQTCCPVPNPVRGLLVTILVWRYCNARVLLLRFRFGDLLSLPQLPQATVESRVQQRTVVSGRGHFGQQEL